MSHETGTFPSLLKTSKVVPVFKNKGSPLEVFFIKHFYKTNLQESYVLSGN